MMNDIYSHCTKIGKIMQKYKTKSSIHQWYYLCMYFNTLAHCGSMKKMNEHQQLCLLCFFSYMVYQKKNYVLILFALWTFAQLS